MKLAVNEQVFGEGEEGGNLGKSSRKLVGVPTSDLRPSNVMNRAFFLSLGLDAERE